MRSRPFVPGAALALLAPVLLALATLTPAGAVEAQSHTSALTLLGGMSIHDDLTPGLDSETVFETGWIAGLQAEKWLGAGRVGLRLNGLFTQRQLETGPDYNVYMADLDLLVRLLSARPGRSVSPYLAFGAGASRYAAVGGGPTLAAGAYGENPVDRVHLLAGLGLDLLPGRRLGLRLEAADKIVLASVGESPESNGLPTVHNMVFTAGLQLRMGAPRPAQELDRPVTVVTVEDRRTDPVEIDGPVLYTVQLFTFIEAATADRWSALLRERGLPVWQLETVIHGERVSRVRVGALQSEVEARRLASAIERDYGWAVWVDRVDADEPVPADAVARTGHFLTRR